MRHIKANKQFVWITFAIVATALLFLVAGCGDNSVTTTTGGGSSQATIQSFTSTPSSEIQIGETSVVEATVVDQSGAALSGQEVTFAVTPSSAGYFTPTSAVTNTDGSAASVFTSTAKGDATLQVSSGAAQRSILLSITDGSVSSDRLLLEMTPSLATANGTDVVDITITAEDASGNPVPDGTVVELAAGERFRDADSDGHWTEGVDELLTDYNFNNDWDPIGNIPRSVTTSGGTATAQYEAGHVATTVYIHATMTDADGTEFAETPLHLEASTSVASITLSTDGEDLRVRGVGGIEFATVTAVAYDEFGATVPDGIPIDLSITAGPGGGENIEGQDIGPVTAYTDASGAATFTVYSGTISGTIRCLASNGTVLSEVTQLVVNAGPPENMTVGADNCNVRAWDFMNVQNVISVNVSDTWGNPVPDSTAVWFSTEEGFVIAEGLTGVGGPKGIAKSTWYSGNPRNDGIVNIFVETDGGNLGDTVAFISSGPATTAVVTQHPSSLVADGADKGLVFVYVTDVNGNYVESATPVEFNYDFGTIANATTSDGCNGSLAKSEYVSDVLQLDYSPVSPDDGIGAVSVVTVQAGGVLGPQTTFTTNFLTGDTYVKNSSIDIDAEIEPGTTVPFTIVVQDRPGNPLGGHQLQITTSYGTLSSNSAVTNKYGEANLFFTAPGAEGAAVITVNDQDPRGNVSFAKKVQVKYAQ